MHHGTAYAVSANWAADAARNFCSGNIIDEVGSYPDGVNTYTEDSWGKLYWMLRYFQDHTGKTVERLTWTPDQFKRVRGVP
jgi:hypothetical protein